MISGDVLQWEMVCIFDSSLLRALVGGCTLALEGVTDEGPCTRYTSLREKKKFECGLWRYCTGADVGCISFS